jgi:Asp-tRNA(Asn)/Glu-tRNA(Gln) amidotransferase A subunit family amidase
LSSEIKADKANDTIFCGVPFLLKDLIAEYRGAPFHEGSFAVKGYVSKVDSELVKRQKAAGLIIVGKTNTPEFGCLPTTEPALYGPTANPWNPSRTPGGSSGGSAAAVAAGIVPMAHGNDGGGSIRIPASCCGLFGLKPTRGRNPLGPLFGDIGSGIVHEHAVTRTVRDSAALLDVTSGPARGDPYYAPPKECPFLEEVIREAGRLKIGEYELEPVTWSRYHAGLDKTGTDYLVALEEIQRFSRKLARWYHEGSWDLILSLKLRIPPTNLGAFKTTPEAPTGWLDATLSFTAFTRIQNLTGQPAMSVPLFWNQDNLPIGVQFAGRFGDEATLFRLAAQLEQARPWADKKPPIHCNNDL